MHEFTPKGQNMQTCTEKVSIFGVVKSSNVYFQSLRSVTSLYKNIHLHGNPGSIHNIRGGEMATTPHGLLLSEIQYILLQEPK